MTALPVQNPPERRAVLDGAHRGARLPGELPLPAPRFPLPVVRTARLSDVTELEMLMAPFVATGDLLPRSTYDLCRHIKEYVVAEAADGSVVACGSLKVYSLDLAEVAGLAVRANHQGTGLGRTLVEALVAEARALSLRVVLALTRKPVFFFHLGFEPADRENFPLKVWADCQRCPRQHSCDEVAVVLRL